MPTVKYSVPIPANPLESIFEACHFLAAERESFLAVYRRAHPHRAPGNLGGQPRWRGMPLRVADLRDHKKNKELHELMHQTLRPSSRLVPEPYGTGPPQLRSGAVRHV